MKTIYLSLCHILLSLCPLAIHAAEPDATFNRVHLQATSNAEVSNDLMQVHLAVELENTDPVKLAEQVNSTMAWALNKLKPVKRIKHQTGGYYTQPVYHKTAIQRWRANQQLKLESADSKLLARLTAELQKKLVIKRMHFRVSDAARRDAENRLITQALDAFKARADIVRKNLGAKAYRIVNVNVNTSGAVIQPVMRDRFSMAQTAATPVQAAGGSSTVTVTVSGLVQLDK